MMDQPLPSGSQMPNSLNGEGVLGKALDGPIDGRARKTGYTGYDRNTTSSQSLGIEGSDQVLLSLVEMRKQQRILALEFFGFAHPEIIPSPLPFVTLNFLRTLTFVSQPCANRSRSSVSLFLRSSRKKRIARTGDGK